MNKIIFKKRQFKKAIRGTNQYQTVYRVKRTQPTGKAYLAAISLGVMLAYIAVPYVVNFYNGVKFQPVYAPTVSKAYAEPVAPTATPTPDQNQVIREQIKTVFGKDADKAFKLLSCENSKLNPNAVNTAGNYPAGSRDIGVFQINEHWQATQGKFLFNPAINIQIAYQIYKENGNSFKLWSCGRRFGI